MSDGLVLDWEVADKITLGSLQSQYKMLEEQIEDHVGRRINLHPDDFARNLYLLDCLEEIIKYYGGTIDGL